MARILQSPPPNEVNEPVIAVDPSVPPKPTRGRPKNSSIIEKPGAVKIDGLSARQRTILAIIRDSVQRRGYPPSIREICEEAGLASTSSVAHQLTVLEKKGFIRRNSKLPRAVGVNELVAKEEGKPGKRGRARTVTPREMGDTPTPAFVPVVGRGRLPVTARIGWRGHAVHAAGRW
jgi:repressor LexA